MRLIHASNQFLAKSEQREKEEEASKKNTTKKREKKTGQGDSYQVGGSQQPQGTGEMRWAECDTGVRPLGPWLGKT